jgi:hypothetical protein
VTMQIRNTAGRDAWAKTESELWAILRFAFGDTVKLGPELADADERGVSAIRPIIVGESGAMVGTVAWVD